MLEKIPDKLEASGTRTKIRVKTINGGQTHLSTAVNDFKVASNNKGINKKWIKLPKRYRTSDLPIDAKETATKETLRKWKYLDNICKKTCQDDYQNRILIAAYCSKATEPIEVIPSQEGGPYTFRTILGSCIIGSLEEKMGQPSLHCNIIKCSSVSIYQTTKHFLAVDTQVEDTGIKEMLQKLYNEQFNEVQPERETWSVW